MMLQKSGPIIVNIAQKPVESTSIQDVLIGAIGLTGVLVLCAILLGLLLGGALIGIKLLRAHLNPEAPADSDTIHIV
jgi:hypothetical protein